VEELSVDLKAVETAREVCPGVLIVAYRRKSQGRIVCSYILAEATGSQVIPFQERL
jgi:hypothetical protein